MIGTGELDEQTAQAILTQLQGGADPGAAAGGAPAGGAPDAGGAAPAPEPAGGGAPKKEPKDDSGSDKEASAIIKQSSALAAELLAEVTK